MNILLFPPCGSFPARHAQKILCFPTHSQDPYNLIPVKVGPDRDGKDYLISIDQSAENNITDIAPPLDGLLKKRFRALVRPPPGGVIRGYHLAFLIQHYQLRKDSFPFIHLDEKNRYPAVQIAGENLLHQLKIRPASYVLKKIIKILIDAGDGVLGQAMKAGTQILFEGTLGILVGHPSHHHKRKDGKSQKKKNRLGTNFH